MESNTPLHCDCMENLAVLWLSGWAVEGRAGVRAHLQIPECTQFVNYGLVCHVTLSGLISFVIYSAVTVFIFPSYPVQPSTRHVFFVFVCFFFIIETG